MKRGPNEAQDALPIDGRFAGLAPPCRSACPADMDIPGFLRAVARGDHAAAWHIIHRDNLFPTVLGWICPRPCESACRLGQVGAPVPVCQIKRWVTASHAPPADLIRRQRAVGPSVAVVGAGPAGLAAAHDLALAGLEVTVLDRSETPGGLLTSCIPDFRLPRWAASGDITRVFSLGIRFEPRFVLRSAAQAAQLIEERNLAAVLLAVGPGDDREPAIPGWRASAATWTAIAFLQRVRSTALRMDGARVIVVGGGNAAIDAARTALRIGARQVQILYRRNRGDMPAFPEEVEAAERDGAELHFQSVVTEVVWDGHQLRGVHCARTSTAHGGRSTAPEVDPASTTFQPCDVIVFAIGQSPTVNDAADHSMVFSCADVPDTLGTVVTAIASGRRTAARVLEALERRGQLPASKDTPAHGESPAPATNGHGVANGDTAVARYANAGTSARGGHATPRVSGSASNGLPILLPTIATGAARRCLACDSLLSLDPNLCILCGMCAQVCTFDALTWSASPNGGEGTWRLVIHDTDCQRCGDCVAVCPAGALGWTPWTHPNRSCAMRSIRVDAPADDSSSCSDGAA